MPDLSPLWISLKVAGLAAIATFFLGIAAAYWMLGYRGRWKSVIEGIFVAPLILPPTVVGFVLLVLFGRNGFIGKLLSLVDFSVVFTWVGAAIAATVVSFPLMYRTALGAFEQIDTTLPQVAQTLGASWQRIFWRVVLPLSVPGILAGMTLSFARALGEFGATLMLAGNIPGQTQTIPMAIYFAVEAGAMSEAWFWVIVILCISLSGIFAVNLWQTHHSHTPSPPSPSPPSFLSSLSSPPSPPSPTSSLHLNIQKHLSSFTLNLAFSAAQETLGILGSSGSGKSMTLRCIAGVETPTCGQIVLNGRVLFDSEKQINLPPHQRRVGLVFQNYALFPHLTIAQNIAFGLQHLPKLAQRQRVSHYLHTMQLEALGDRYPHQLSGGQQQRVALARALAPEPEVLLLDEPLSALDTYLRSQVERQLKIALSEFDGVALFVTHNLEEAFRVCDNLMVMSGGRAIAFGSKHQIFERPPNFQVAQLTGCKNFSQAIPSGTHQLEATDWGCTLTTLEPLPPTLSQIGIRAHQIHFISSAEAEPQPLNTFPCWLADTSETPHRMTLYLKLNTPSNHPTDYHLQAEVFKEMWMRLKDQPFPWQVQLDPARLILLTEN